MPRLVKRRADLRQRPDFDRRHHHNLPRLTSARDNFTIIANIDAKITAIDALTLEDTSVHMQIARKANRYRVRLVFR
jgi:hypothetical protein